MLKCFPLDKIIHILPRLDTEKSRSPACFARAHRIHRDGSLLSCLILQEIPESGGIARHALKAFPPMYCNRKGCINLKALRPRTNVCDRACGDKLVQADDEIWSSKSLQKFHSLFGMFRLKTANTAACGNDEVLQPLRTDLIYH